MEKAQEANEVIFHRDGLSWGQWKALEALSWFSCRITAYSSLRSWRDGAGERHGWVFLSPPPPWPCFVTSSPMASLCPRHCLASFILKFGSSSHTLRKAFPGGSVDKNPQPVQGTRVQSPVREDSTCHRATEPICHNC